MTTLPEPVAHDPGADWCACEPNSLDRCAYRRLADTVIEHLNPRDGDEAEESLCMSAVERAATYLRSLPCTCAPGYDDAPCGRCAALGLWHGEAR